MARSPRLCRRNNSGEFIEERSRDVAGAKARMVDDVFEKGNVGLDAANAKFAQRAVHALAGFGEFGSPGCHLYQKRIVIRSKHRSGVRRASVETNSEACR